MINTMNLNFTDWIESIVKPHFPDCFWSGPTDAPTLMLGKDNLQINFAKLVVTECSRPNSASRSTAAGAISDIMRDIKGREYRDRAINMTGTNAWSVQR